MTEPDQKGTAARAAVMAPTIVPSTVARTYNLPRSRSRPAISRLRSTCLPGLSGQLVLDGPQVGLARGQEGERGETVKAPGAFAVG